MPKGTAMAENAANAPKIPASKNILIIFNNYPFHTANLSFFQGSIRLTLINVDGPCRKHSITVSEKNEEFQKMAFGIVHSHACALHVMVKDAARCDCKLNHNQSCKCAEVASIGHPQGAGV